MINILNADLFKLSYIPGDVFDSYWIFDRQFVTLTFNSST